MERLIGTPYSFVRIWKSTTIMHADALGKFKKGISRVAELIETRSAVEVDWRKGIVIEALPLAYVLRGECLEEYRRLVRGILGRPNWRDRFSEKYIQTGIQKILRDVLTQNRQADVGKDLEDFVLQTEAINTEQRVFLPIQFLDLKIPELQIGKVVLRPITPTLLAEVLEGTQARRGRLFSEEFSWTLAEFRVVAEPDRAIERAETETRRAVDVLHYARSFLLRPGVYAPVGLQGDTPTGDRGAVIRTAGDKGLVHSTTDGTKPVELNTETLERLKPCGLQELSRLLCEENPCEFDEALLSSIHWFATAQKLRERPNQVLALSTALETMLTGADSTITNTVAEGVAFVIEEDFDGRKRIKSQVKKLYGLRSKITHGGQPVVDLCDLQDLILLTRDFLHQLVWYCGRFKTKKDLSDWIEVRRLS